jgi:hypothetical protein
MFCIEAKESFFSFSFSSHNIEKKAGEGREKQKNNVSDILQNAKKNKHGSKQKHYCGNNI